MNRLTKTQLVYYKILFVIWQLATYYADIFCFSAPSDPLDMNAQIINNGGVSYIKVTFPRIKPLVSSYSAEQQQDILQKYLNYVLLPGSDIAPYSGGDTVYDLVEALYVAYAYYQPSDTDYIMWQIMYINDPISYDMYRMWNPKPSI